MVTCARTDLAAMINTMDLKNVWALCCTAGMDLEDLVCMYSGILVCMHSQVEDLGGGGPRVLLAWRIGLQTTPDPASAGTHCPCRRIDLAVEKRGCTVDRIPVGVWLFHHGVFGVQSLLQSPVAPPAALAAKPRVSRSSKKPASSFLLRSATPKPPFSRIKAQLDPHPLPPHTTLPSAHCVAESRRVQGGRPSTSLSLILPFPLFACDSEPPWPSTDNTPHFLRQPHHPSNPPTTTQPPPHELSNHV